MIGQQQFHDPFGTRVIHRYFARDVLVRDRKFNFVRAAKNGVHEAAEFAFTDLFHKFGLSVDDRVIRLVHIPKHIDSDFKRDHGGGFRFFGRKLADNVIEFDAF